MMKIVFFGTPKTSVPFLEFLGSLEEVVGVVTRPDKPSGRGMEMALSPVKIVAEQKKIPLFQPTQLKEPQFLGSIKALNPEVGIVVAYGRLLPPELMQIFSKGIFNVHFSLLPRWRGASPMQWAILNGDEITGVTIFKIASTLDTGEIWLQKKVSVDSQETAISLEEKLVPLGISALNETLDLIKKEGFKGMPQGDSPTPYARLLKKEDARINWNQSAQEIHRRVRALVSLGAFTVTDGGQRLKILRSKVVESGKQTLSCGSIVEIERGIGFVIKCNQGNLLVLEVQPEGKKRMDAWSYLQGHKLATGNKFS